MTPADPRVAIACSGLGHVQRGIESWAFDLARALRQEGRSVALFSGGPIDDAIHVCNLHRAGVGNRRVTRVLRQLGGWRYGFGSPYETEQTSFALALWPRVRRGFDILHVQDPGIAEWFERAYRLGLSRARVIYANGTGEGVRTMRRFGVVQLLTQEAYDDFLPARPPATQVFHVPNFIDTRMFAPGDQAAARAAFDLPADRTIFLCCSAIRRHHKRVDHLLHEFEILLRRGGSEAMLVIAGAWEPGSDEIIAAGTQRLGDRVRFLVDVPRSRMASLYQAADVFTLASLHEMFGIVLLEAAASGLPIVCHDAPGFRAIVGPAGEFRDLATTGDHAAGLAAMLDPGTRARIARAARDHVERNYSATSVVPRVTEMYAAVCRPRAKR